MNINRNNYEEYFILYLDNELDSESRRRVEAFAQQNPDLKAELDTLLQSKLTPDADISFSDKGSLMRFDNASISVANYEEWLTSYIDDELTEGERNDVEVFVAGNPAIQRELNLLQQTKLQPETIVFPYKESLYHKEEKARVIPIRWWRIAAAAVLLLGIGTTTIVLLNNKKGNDGGGIAIDTKVEPTNNNAIITQPLTNPTNKKAPLVADKKKEEAIGTKEPRNTIAIKQKVTRPEEKKEQTMLVKNEEKRLTNNLAELTSVNPNIKKQIEPGKMIAVVPIDLSPAKESSLKNTKEKTELTKVTDEAPQPSYAVEQQSSGNKGLRGFLRKVTRTFEKRTNIKATDDDDRLLIAGLAIKM